MKIVFVIRSLQIGGAERQLCELVTGLRSRGHQVKVAVFYPGGRFAELLAARGDEVCPLGKSARWDLWSPLRAFARLVNEFDADVVYSFMPAENLFALVARLLHRKTVLVWGIQTANMNPTIYGRVVSLMYRIEHWLMRTPDCIIANSTEALREHGLTADPRAHAIRNGIDTAELFPDAEAGQRWRAAQDIAATDTVIALVGRVEPIKRVDLFLEAAVAARAAGSRARFLVIGPPVPEYVERLRQSTAAYALAGQLRWIGVQHDRRSLYNAIDCLVSSSDAEGFSNVIAEGMACGTPVVGTDVGDSRVLIGDFGTVVAARDVRAITSAMVAARRESVAGRAARHAYIAGAYGVDRLLDRSEQVLLQLVQQAA